LLANLRQKQCNKQERLCYHARVLSKGRRLLSNYIRVLSKDRLLLSNYILVLSKGRQLLSNYIWMLSKDGYVFCQMNRRKMCLEIKSEMLKLPDEKNMFLSKNLYFFISTQFTKLL